MFSIPDYVPFCDVADLCLDAANILSRDGRRPKIPAFEGWDGLDEWPRVRVVRTLAALLQDMVLQQPKRFALISANGRIVRPSNRILALQNSTLEISLEMPLVTFRQYESLRYSRYTFLDTTTWCIKRMYVDEADIDVDEDGIHNWPPEEVVVSKFLEWSLAVHEEDVTNDAQTLLEELIAADVLRQKSPKAARGRGRPSQQDDVRAWFSFNYPNGKPDSKSWRAIQAELAAVDIKLGQTTIKAAIKEIEN